VNKYLVKFVRKRLAILSAFLVVAGIAIQSCRDWRRIDALQPELDAVQASYLEADRLRRENGPVSVAQIDTNALIQLRQEHLPLLRLRGQVALLAAAVSAATHGADATNRINSVAQQRWEDRKITKSDPLRSSLAAGNVAPSGNETEMGTLRTALWETLNGNRDSLASWYSATSKHLPTDLSLANLRRAFTGVANFQLCRRIEYGSGMVNLFFNLERSGVADERQARQGSIWLKPEDGTWKIEFLGVSTDPIPF